MRIHFSWQTQRYAAAFFLVICAASLLLFRTNREFISLTPSEGSNNLIPIHSNQTFIQEFTTYRTSLSGIGLSLRPIAKQLPAGKVVVSIHQRSKLLLTREIDVSLIDNTGFTRIDFTPYSTTRGEKLEIHIRVTENISGQIGLQQRELDNSYNSADTAFFINNDLQPTTLGYQVFYSYQPALVVQVSALLFYAVALLLFPGLISIKYFPWLHSGVVSLLAILPSLLAGEQPLLLGLAIFIALSGSLFYLAAMPLSLSAAVLGAHAFSLSSWLTLQYLGERHVLLIAAVLPWLAYFWKQRHLRSKLLYVQWLIVAIYGLCIAFFASNNWSFLASPWFIHASLKDTYLDPYQVASAQKILGHTLPWDHFGSYFGVINLSLAFVGILTWRYKYVLPACFVVLGLILFQLHSYFVILATFGLSLYVAAGASSLAAYLGSNKLAKVIIICLIIITLLDLLFVIGGSQEAAYL